MYAARLWSVRHARFLSILYVAVERALIAADPLCRFIGYARLEAPVARLESAVKDFLFDCKMCGQCALSETGMSCPMNCPKSLRNGPCGGVRSDGTCEIVPTMRCVWVEACSGRARMGLPAVAPVPNRPIDHGSAGASSWLRVAREKSAARRAAGNRTGR